MIIDIKTEIRQALLNNAALVSLLGGPRVYQLAAPRADEYPRITFFEVTNYDSEFADDGAYASDVTVQIDVWAKDSTSTIAAEIDVTMKGLGYFRTSGADLYEDDTKVYHKALRYRTQIQEVE
ncbi:tail completion protein gp17 [Paenibacillus ehimensis]|uniref:tail completion protein gp17 n=1 Tax=Paenibacillus ehimensis TaxID=79264 RepID=UPI000684C092|nr:DUF3168 domain-containing protein [Paenibacillus ehimensis]